MAAFTAVPLRPNGDVCVVIMLGMALVPFFAIAGHFWRVSSNSKWEHHSKMEKIVGNSTEVSGNRCTISTVPCVTRFNIAFVEYISTLSRCSFFIQQFDGEDREAEFATRSLKLCDEWCVNAAMGSATEKFDNVNECEAARVSKAYTNRWSDDH